MAYAAIVSLSQTLLEQQQVADIDQHHIKSLHEKLCFLQSFMEDDHYAYFNTSGERADPLEERIREVAYQAADVIELHVLNRVRAERSMAFKYGQMQTLEKRYSRALQKVNAKIDSIVEEATKLIKSDYQVETPIPPFPLGASGSSRQASTSGTVVGFQDDLLEMKSRLCGESQNLQIISIVGMGGIGKTTLANTIFNDSLVMENFYARAWVTISQEYCIRDILFGLLRSFGALTNDVSKKSNEILAELVYKSLKGRKFLIIMDDMWSTKAWDDVRRVLPDDNNGSRVIITTRLSQLAVYADPSSPLHQMQLLNEHQSWSLLQHSVFAREWCPPELEKIGWMIAGKCGGLPLGVILVAGLLSKVDAALNHWEKFAVNVSSALATNDEHLLKIFSLSYNNLPHHLRACFMYMASFPENREIQVSKLKMLWTAEGFLKPSISKSSEEVAEECVLDLVKRNLISITQKSYRNSRFRFCRIHDLLRDYCIRKARDENFLQVMKKGNDSQANIQNEQRRLCNFINGSVPTITSNSFVRSLFFSNNNQLYLTSLAISSRLLRVLDGPNVLLTCIPAAITGLIHLRYLAFTHNQSVQFVVPATILKLINLQTFIIEAQNKYSRTLGLKDEPNIQLPPDIWKMLKLRHLILNNFCFSSVSFSGEGFVLGNLRTLSRVANLSFGKKTIEMIPNIKKLRVIYQVEGVNPVMKWSKYHLNNLIHLHQLESLSITCNVEYTTRSYLRSSFTKNLALPKMLKKLTLSDCILSRRNLSMIGLLANLEVLKLRNLEFEEEDWTLYKDEFPRLKLLLMQWVPIKCWQTEYTHFPGLEQLIIWNCWQLEEIPLEIGEIPTLQCIELFGALKSARDSVIRIQEEQQSLGNDSLQVRLRIL